MKKVVLITLVLFIHYTVLSYFAHGESKILRFVFSRSLLSSCSFIPNFFYNAIIYCR